MKGEEVADLSQLRKDVMTGMLHLELRHEVLMGGRKRLGEDPNNMNHNVREGRKVDRAILPTISL